MNQLALEKTDAGALAKREPTVADMLQMVIERGLTSDNVTAFKELVQLHREEVKMNAEKEFNEAFLQLQADLPVIQGMKKGMHEGLFYATFEDIDEIVRPYCLRNGFTYAFREDAFADGRVTIVMDLSHKGGHTRSIPYSVRPGSGPRGANESQADMSGHTYAQRGAIEHGLCLRILNKRPDARMEGGKITAERAFDIERRAKETNSDTAKLLKLAGVSKFEDIPEAKAEVIEGILERKEKGGK